MARNEVYYEWAVEYTDDYGDIQDIEHADKLAELGDMTPHDGLIQFNVKPVLTLIRHIGNEGDGELDRTYAYPIQSRLPAEFQDGKNIPKRFREELARFCMT
jgi:hypothetical protein